MRVLVVEDQKVLANRIAEGLRDQAVHQLLLYSLIGLGVMGLLSAAAGWLVAGRALRPVHAITGAARRASEANLGERLALDGPHDELKELADTYDAMLARLDAAFASQRWFVADASHEMRTPLTVMRTAIDVTLAKPGRTPAQLEDMAVEVRHAVDRAEALIEALLTLARSDRGTLAQEPADLAVLAEDALDTAAPAIRAGSLRVETALEAARTAGNSVLLDRLVANLVDNAVRHNAPGGSIQVATGMRGDAAFLSVSNGGRQIPADLTPELFEPFRRLNVRADAVPGAGLGLSIVRSIVTAHHGEVVARSAGGRAGRFRPAAGSAAGRRAGRGHTATGSQPRRCVTDWRYSHSMASLSRWASRPPLLMPAISATPRWVPTETTNPLSRKVNASGGLPFSSASRLRATVSPSSSATCASGGSTCPVPESTTEARSPAT